MYQVRILEKRRPSWAIFKPQQKTLFGWQDFRDTAGNRILFCHKINAETFLRPFIAGPDDTFVAPKITIHTLSPSGDQQNKTQ